MVNDLIQANFTPAVSLLFMLIFLWTNVTFDKKIVRLFTWASIMLALSALADNGEIISQYEHLGRNSRMILIAVANICRPTVIYIVLLILVNNIKFRYKSLYAIPSLVNLLIIVVGYGRNIVFNIDKSGCLITGKLFRVSQASAVIYMLLIVAYVIREMILDRAIGEGIIMIAIITVTLSAVYVKVAYGLQSIQNSSNAIAITFFYLYYHTQSFKRDPLTGVLNRRCFYLDAEKFRDNISAIVSIDLNDLKTINDNMGHAKGDMAICTMVNTVRKNMLSNCKLYRTGGDEFQLICQGHTINKIYAMVENIKKEMHETSYTWAMGVVDVNLGKDLDELLARADEAMYVNKKEMKANRINNEKGN